MKKKIIYSSALATFLCVSSALAGGPEIFPVEDYFSGFYIGGTVSGHLSDFDASTSVDLIEAVPPPPAMNPILAPGNLLRIFDEGASWDAFGGVQGGFGWTFVHRWYLGIQGFADFGTSRSSQTSNSTLIDTNIANLVTDHGTVQNTTQVRLASDYGVAGKVGFLVTPMTMIYGKIGAVWANLKVTNTTTATNQLNFNFPGTTTCFECINTVASASSADDSTKIGAIFAIGAEQFIYRDFVSFNIEYSSTSYGPVTTGPVNLVSSTTATGLFPFQTNPRTLPVTTTTNVASTRVDSILAGLNFYFGREWF